MLDVRYSSKFKQDFRRRVKRRCKMTILQQIIEVLRIPGMLPSKNADHNLTGDYAGYRECRIDSDWLLIYRRDGKELLLYRMGTRADLFRM